MKGQSWSYEKKKQHKQTHFLQLCFSSDIFPRILRHLCNFPEIFSTLSAAIDVLQGLFSL